MAVLQSRLSTVDLAYQVRAGDLMLRSHILIRSDTLSFTGAGRPWLDQQWGAQVLLALTHRAGGWAALAVTKAALLAMIFGLVFLACRAARSTPRLAAGLTLVSLAMSLAGLSLRPQLLAMALFAATLWLIVARRRRPAGMWIVPVLVATWANIHGSFFLGPLLLGLAWLQDREDRSPFAWRTAAAALVSLAATLLNPFGVRVWTYVLDISTNPAVRDLASEWQRPSLRHYTGAMFFLSGLAVAAVLGRRRPLPSWPSLLSFGILFAIGLIAVRGVFWWALAAPVMLCEVLREDPVPVRAELPPSLLNTAIAALLVAVTVAFSPAWRGGDSFLTSAPHSLTARLELLLLPQDRMFNAQRWGSWFELALQGHPVFVDSRIEVYPASVWQDYLNVSLAKLGWQGVLDRWKVRVVAASRHDQAPLIDAIATDPGWTLAYEDSDGSIFVRAGPTPGSS
jgi:hypothetical protein